MVRLRSGAAGLARAAMGKVRPSITAPSRGALRSKFNKVSTRVSKRVSAGKGAGGGTFAGTPATGVYVSGRISADLVDRKIGGQHLSGDVLARWTAIQNGHLPEDDDTPRPLSPEQVDEKEADALAQIQRWGEQQNDQIREETRADVLALRRQADALADTAQGPARVAVMRQVAALERQAEDRIEQGRRDLAKVGYAVQDEREDMRRELRKAVEKRQEAYDERIETLKAGLDREIEKEVNRRYFQGGEFELEEFELD